VRVCDSARLLHHFNPWLVPVDVAAFSFLCENQMKLARTPHTYHDITATSSTCGDPPVSSTCAHTYTYTHQILSHTARLSTRQKECATLFGRPGCVCMCTSKHWDDKGTLKSEAFGEKVAIPFISPSLFISPNVLFHHPFYYTKPLLHVGPN